MNLKFPRFSEKYPEMGFLDIRLTKDSTLLLHKYSKSILLTDFTENHTLFCF